MSCRHVVRWPPYTRQLDNPIASSDCVQRLIVVAQISLYKRKVGICVEVYVLWRQVNANDGVALLQGNCYDTSPYFARTSCHCKLRHGVEQGGGILSVPR